MGADAYLAFELPFEICIHKEIKVKSSDLAKKRKQYEWFWLKVRCGAAKHVAV